MLLPLTLLSLSLAGCPTDPADDDDATEEPTPEPPCGFWGAADVVGEVEDAALDEISGLVASRQTPGALWVHEDSGAGPLLVALDTNGRTIAELTLTDAPAADWEDMAIGACAGEAPPADGGPWCLVVGDFGDNGESRPFVTLLTVEEPAVDLDRGEVEELSLTATEVRAVYGEGAQNAEGLVLEPDGTPVVITKRNDGLARLYRMPLTETDPPAEAQLLAETRIGPVGGLVDTVTGADLNEAGDRLLLRTYTAGYLYELDEDGLPGIDPLQQRVLPVGAEPQGETIAWSADGRDILHVSEDVQPPLYRLSCRD